MFAVTSLIAKGQSRFIKSYARHLSLLRDKNFVGGSWLDAESRSSFPVVNPANDKVIGSVPDSDVNDSERAVSVASDTFPSWSTTAGKERGDLLRKLYELMHKNQEGLAKIITAESGKPLAEARAEVAYSAGYVEFYSEEAKRVHGEIGSAPNRTREILIVKEPIGVVGMITPWNFPLAMLARKMSAALAAGCCCVSRPAEDTPFSALALAALVQEAGFPAGSFNVVTSSRKHAADIGKLFCTSEKIAGISFTGSTAVGKLLYRQCADTVKRVALELGGNAAFVVFPTADLNKAVQGLMASKFRNTGQACNATNRVMVHESIYDEFLEKIVSVMKSQLVLGDGFDSKVNAGPLINDQQLGKITGLVNDAVGKGAQACLGGGVHPTLGGRFFQPTVLTGITEDMEIHTEEVFGPVVPIYKFKDEEEVLALVNGTRRGLANYFYSNDYSQIWRVAKKIQSGMVGVNECAISSVEIPFGGIKESGIGREGSRHGIEEYLQLKYICMGGLNN